MEWVLRSPQMHSAFGNLGFVHPDGYHINENCNAALETILHNILTEDKYLRTYRRSISFGQNINKDIIPLLLHAKNEKTIELLTRILVNLTIPIECLLSVDVISKTDFGKHTVFEINNLLTSTKNAFTDHRTTKVIIDFLKKNVDTEQKRKLSAEQCTNISNSLLLLRNVLHIPEEPSCLSPVYSGAPHTAQNQILWNIFSQSIDKILIKLMTIPDATNWGVTMVQLIALLYKDQHVVTLHKLLNIWLEASLSESSEDNESNTSPPDRGSEDSSPMLTSDPTSDSSDTGGSGKCNDEPNSVNNEWAASSHNNSTENGNHQQFQPPPFKKKDVKHKIGCTEDTEDVVMKSDNDTMLSSTGGGSGRSETSNPMGSPKSEKKTTVSENSDCGYGTQIENQESISTSSNEDDMPFIKPVHQKPHNPKQRINNKTRVSVTIQDRKRKKIFKRGKANIINVQGLWHKTPSNDDISNVLKEFTVDFLLKGYNSLVHTLHNQILVNPELEIDTSHFFWLVTYFLKFATQIELDLDHICSVLCFEIVSYLTAEGVNLCEQFELAIKLDGNDLKPSIRRLHLVVTAIREFVQAIEVYKKFTHICDNDQEALVKLQVKMCETEELRSLLVLLLRHYNPKYHTKQYLQDLVVTNHILLIFLDNVMKLPEYISSHSMTDHIKQFATPEIMYQYGLLLEDYSGNGEFVNDCIFTLMHHVGGELDCLITLFQPKILKTFTSIWKSEFDICDDWSDLIEYVINTFIKKPHTLQSPANFRLDTENFDDGKISLKPSASQALEQKPDDLGPQNNLNNATPTNASNDRWTEEELSTLSWNYMQCNSSADMIGEIVKLYKEDGIIKTRESVLQELFRQNLINRSKFETVSKEEIDRNIRSSQAHKDSGRDDEIGKLCEQLAQDGKSCFLDWVQYVLLEACFAKIFLEKTSRLCHKPDSPGQNEVKIMNFELFKKKENDLPIPSPVAYHSLLYNQSVPLVPWNCAQAAICKDLKFLQLLHKLGLHMPVDTGKVFIRIPYFWTADQLHEMAGKIIPINPAKLKFSINDLTANYQANTKEKIHALSYDLTIDMTMSTPKNIYQISKQSHLATLVNFTPMPSTSFSPEGGECGAQNWLEIVKKSQECKINFLGSNTIPQEDEDGDITMSRECDVRQVNVGQASSVSSPFDSEYINQKQPFSAQIPDSEYYNNSVCETASVASDLTRMYVSDEEDKPDMILLPTAAERDKQVDTHTYLHLEGIAQQRPRVQFSPPI